ncbi:hypothetical protein AYI68_g7552 [Smittium mucronatum]|uniref:Nudix hydrolase domain-containing protein n=1 Tax=Smittium mucronatum TaxID=133383 RepID=A0A1R0GNC3_9FUNG|nr:hypothetical protein AYI68_g7552 [Smittium mucronatum]
MKFDSILSVIKHCATISAQNLNHTDHYAFLIDSVLVAFTNPKFIIDLQDYKASSSKLLFLVDHVKRNYTFQDWCASKSEREMHLAIMLDEFRENSIWPPLKKWRNELYPIYGSLTEKDGIFCSLERASAQIFGFRTFGVHLNGYLKLSPSEKTPFQTPNSLLADYGIESFTKPTLNYPTNFEIKMWIGKRSKSKPLYPSMLDQIVAGGISSGETPLNSLFRECDEEAGIPQHIVEKSSPCGTVQYCTNVSKYGFVYQPETQYVYDLQMPLDFVPVPKDGEVEDFYLLSMEQIYTLMLAGYFKPNCALIIIDFMIRFGFISPETEPDYLQIVDSLHTTLPFPGPPSKKSN